MNTGRTCSNRSRDSSTRPRLNRVTACWASAVLSASRSPSLANSSRACDPELQRVGEPALVAGQHGEVPQRLGHDRRPLLGPRDRERGVEPLAGLGAPAVPGQRLARPQMSLGDPVVEAGLARDLGRPGREVDGVVVLAGLEGPAALAEQGRDRAGGVVEPRAQLGHPAQRRGLGGAVALPFEDVLARGDDVEEQPGVVGRDQLLGPLQEVGGLVEREHAAGPASGSQVPGRRLGVVGPVEVLGDDRRILLDPPRARGDVGQPAGRPPVVLAPAGAQHAVVGDVAQQGVLEEELARGLERRELPLEDEVAREQVVERVARRRRRRHGLALGRQVGDRVVPEDPADDRGSLQRSPFRRGQRVETGLEQALERRGDDQSADELVHDPPPRRVGDDDPRVDEPGHQLLDVERVALGRVDDEVDELRRRVVDLLEQLEDQGAALPSRQRTEGEPDVVVQTRAPARAFLQERGTGGRDDHDGNVTPHPVGVVEEAHRRGVGPVQVLEEDDDRLGPRQQGEVPAQGDGRLVADALRLGRDARAGGLVGPEVEAQPRPDDVGSADGLLALAVRHGEPGLELLADHAGRVALGDLHPGGDDVAGQRVRAVLLDVGRTAAEPPDHLRLSREPEVEVAQQPALADAGVTDDVDDEVPTLVDDVEEPVLEEPDLAGPAHRARLDALDDAELVEPEPARSLRDDERRRRPARRAP